MDQRTNVQPTFYPPLTQGIQPGDPFTPLLRAYEDDRVEIRILVGAHEEGHNFTVNGIKWLFEPGTPEDPSAVNNSGYRNSQMMGISEHFEFHVPVLPLPAQNSTDRLPAFYDFRYAPGVAVDDQWNGLWGILRAYRGSQPVIGGAAPAAEDGVVSPPADAPLLLPLPSNPDGMATISTANAASSAPGVTSTAACPSVRPALPARPLGTSRPYLARDVLTDQTLIYNPRTNRGGRLEDPTAIIYVRNDDIDPATGKLKLQFRVEPLILRANAGDCITLNLTNHLTQAIDLEGYNTLPMIVENFNANQIKPSSKVGLHPQLLFYDVTKSDGMNVGFNLVQTANPGQTVQYIWYAGDVKIDPATLQPVYTPVEFGATNLMPADPIKHSNKGAIGALIIEPADTQVVFDTVGLDGLRTHAEVTLQFNPYRPSLSEKVLLYQNDINMRFGERTQFGHLKAVPNLGDEDDPEDTGQKAVNYRTEPMWKRMDYEPDLQFSETRKKDFTKSLANIAGNGNDPVTPVFSSSRATPVRFRVLHPGGHSRNQGFILHGHEWQEEPYIDNSTKIGNNPTVGVERHTDRPRPVEPLRCGYLLRRGRSLPSHRRLPVARPFFVHLRRRHLGHLPRTVSGMWPES